MKCQFYLLFYDLHFFHILHRFQLKSFPQHGTLSNKVGNVLYDNE